MFKSMDEMISLTNDFLLKSDKEKQALKDEFQHKMLELEA